MSESSFFSAFPSIARGLVIGAGLFVLLLGVFAAGVNIGERKARHFSGWYENYPRMMPSRRPPVDKHPLPGGHGVFGKILSVTGNDLIIQGKDGIEEHVVVNSSTVIRVGQETVTLQDLPTDLTQTEAAVFGSPEEQGQIQARLIRLFVRP